MITAARRLRTMVRMRRWRLRATAALLGLAFAMSAADSFAQTVVAPSPADTSEVREVQVAFALGPARSTMWFGARLYGASDTITLVIPVAPGAVVDPATDAWFEALRLATNPRVLPPATTPPPCGSSEPPASGTFEVVGDASHTASLAPGAGSAVRSFSEIVLWAQDQGLSLSFDQLSAFADMDLAGYKFVTIPFDPAPGETLLRTIRVSAPSSTLRVPLLLSRTGSSSAPAFVYVIGEGKASPTGWPSTAVDPSSLRWRLTGQAPHSNYAELWSSSLAAHDDSAWVIDAASHALLFSTTAFASGKASVPSVASAYFSRAAAYGDAEADYVPCVMRVEGLAASSSRGGEPCAPGAIASSPLQDGGGCTEHAAAGEIDPADLRCGATADDFALAFAGMTLSQAWLTRWTGRLGPWQAKPEEPFKIEPGAPLMPITSCPDWDTSGCEADAGSGSPGGSGSSPDAGSSTPGSSGGGTVPGGGSGPYDPGQDEPSYDDTANSSGSVYVETSCWGDSTSSTSDGSGDSCGGDSSSSSSSDGSSACGGDSSSSSDEQSGCGGDSSSSDGDSACGGDSSSSEGDSCSGDSSGGEQSACSGSSSSSSGGDSCSGSGSSSSGSSGCSGGGSSAGSSDCSISSSGRRRGGRLPMSAMTILIVAGLWPLRRWRRSAERKDLSSP